ncbi:MAG TPA: hypothetical protein ENN40_03235 [Candidatus Aminicenantes bacterium]|nr:hypothetical protein [Candidatus Aminicenantes bacterium]
MLNAVQNGSYGYPLHHPSIINRDILNNVTDAFVHRHGYFFLRDPEAPAFMRRLCGVSVKWPRVATLVPETPGPITRLLETLFSCVLGDDFPLEEKAGVRVSQ